jgi:integrase
MGVVAPESMKLSDFANDSLARTGDQIRESTRIEYAGAMKHFIATVSNVDYQTVTYKHGEVFIQSCLDQGDAPATAAKKLRHVKRLFQLAVDRGQLDDNPIRRLKEPKVPRVRVYSVDECERILKAAHEVQNESVLQWDFLITLALITGMRKSEFLNMVWSDIDFEDQIIEVNHKNNTNKTWEWRIKDTDHRTLGITEDVTSLLVDLQNKSPEGYPYVLVPPGRYDHIQQRRKDGRWSLSDARLKVINNFKNQFDLILRRAGIKTGRFHDLRNTAITKWFMMGLREYEVMRLAGHSKFETTHRFYLAVADDLVDRARQAGDETYGQSLARIWHAPLSEATNKKGQQA